MYFSNSLLSWTVFHFAWCHDVRTNALLCGHVSMAKCWLFFSSQGSWPAGAQLIPGKHFILSSIYHSIFVFKKDVNYQQWKPAGGEMISLFRSHFPYRERMVRTYMKSLVSPLGRASDWRVGGRVLKQLVRLWWLCSTFCLSSHDHLIAWWR